MLNLKNLRYQEAGNVATVLFDAAINMDTIRDLEAICARLEDESPCDVLVFDAGEGHLTRGIDLGEFDPNRPLDIHGFHKWEKILTWIERLKKLTIAVIRGQAVGAGVHLTLVCDLRLATCQATFAVDEVRRGFLPGMATFRLAKYVGLGRAKFLSLTGRRLSAAEALEWGLLDQVEEPEQLDEALNTLIRGVHPIHADAVYLNRRLLNESYSVQYEDAIGNFLAAQHRAITREAFSDLVTAARKEV